MQNPRYVLAETYPRRIVFRNGEVEFETVSELDPWDRKEWVFLARRVDRPGCVLRLAWAHFHEMTLQDIIHRRGFILCEGSPEARLLEMLVAKGHAQRLPAIA